VKSLGRIIRSVQAFGRGLSDPLGSGQTQPAGIGLALGGGFARGIAHIGVLKVLGAAYCSGVTIPELEQMATRVRFKDFARWTLSRYGFASNERMIKFLSSILKVKTFEELRIPLAVTATDFSTGAGAVFHSGPLVDPVRASCAYPGMFLPVKIRGRLLVDGMLAYAVPTVPLREMGAQKVLAVHLKGTWTNGDAGPRHLFDVIGQCFAIAQEMNCGVWKAAADLIIDPNVNGFKYDDFERSVELIRSGETATHPAASNHSGEVTTTIHVGAGAHTRPAGQSSATPTEELRLGPSY